jgi:hypothetical protein
LPETRANQSTSFQNIPNFLPQRNGSTIADNESQGRENRMTSTSAGSGEDGSAASWTEAKKQAAALGVIPSSFSVVVRALINDQVTFQAKMRASNKFQVARLLKGPSFKIMLYFATKSLRPLKLAGLSSWSVGSMMTAFEPLDLAALIASFVYYRKCKKLVPEHAWGNFNLSLGKEPQFGASAGSAIPEIGAGLGLIASSFQHFARCSFALKHTDAYQKYSAHAKGASPADILRLEQESFGCTAPQVAVMLLSAAGFGTDVGNGLSIAFDPSRPSATLKDDWAARMRHARIWIDTALQGLDQPSDKMAVRFFPSKEQHEWLKQCNKLIRDGQVGWLQRTKSDLTQKEAPELFAVAKGTEDIPDALRDVFSLEEITSMEEEDFDELIDQIDEEQATGKHPEVLDGKDLNAIEDIVA